MSHLRTAAACRLVTRYLSLTTTYSGGAKTDPPNAALARRAAHEPRVDVAGGLVAPHDVELPVAESYAAAGI
jgi:hypothetical protein